MYFSKVAGLVPNCTNYKESHITYYKKTPLRIFLSYFLTLPCPFLKLCSIIYCKYLDIVGNPKTKKQNIKNEVRAVWNNQRMK